MTTTLKPCCRVHFPPDFTVRYIPRGQNSISRITVREHMVDYFLLSLLENRFCLQFCSSEQSDLWKNCILLNNNDNNNNNTGTAQHLIKIIQADAPYLARVCGLYNICGQALHSVHCICRRSVCASVCVSVCVFVPVPQRLL